VLNPTELEILNYLKSNETSSSKVIHDNIDIDVSYATLKRNLIKLHTEKLIDIIGKGKATKYKISSIYELIEPIDLDLYYQKEIDERKINSNFNFQLISNILKKNNVFSDIELSKLEELQEVYNNNAKQLSDLAFKKELERLAIDLSWKSSQIEGNTYSLLETEKLLKDKETASGKTKDEATMLLNHKEAIDFIIENPQYLNPLSVSKMEDIHSLLMKELIVEKNIRNRRVGISGTNYKPLDNEFQIKEALLELCELVNNKENVFEKALLALVLISYIQPFVDGNKRTARIVSNSILMHYNYCPISFRTVDSIEYKKAMLLFYEQNNISAIKRIFIQQFTFAVDTYF